MDNRTLEDIRKMDLDLQWSSQRGYEGTERTLLDEFIDEQPYFLMAADPNGGYWTIAPRRSQDPVTGKTSPGGRLEGVVYPDEKPFELAQTLIERGIQEVTIFRIELKKTIRSSQKGAKEKT